MKVYLDTNTYLSYLSPTSDIKSLEKLKKLTEDGKVELVLPSQTRTEFLRHFKERVQEVKDKLQKVKTQILIPNELKGKKKEFSEQEKAIMQKIDSLNEDLEKLRSQNITDLKKHLASTEKLLKEIFKLATFFEFTDEVVLKAILRYAKDLPPKKNDHKFGDAIIWETLKENIRNEEIVIVSTDPDFRAGGSKSKKAVINKLLASEWKKLTDKKATLYITLGQFVNTLDKQDKVSQEAIRKEEIQANTIRTLFHTQPISSNLGMLSTRLMSGATNSAFLNTLPTLTSSEIFLNQSSPQSNILSGGRAYLTDLTTSSRAVFSEACKNCGKGYVPSLMTVNVNNWCEECSGRGYQALSK